MANNPMFEFHSPVGRIVQGSPVKQQLRDMDTNELEFDDKGQPIMGIFLAIAIPKMVGGQPNPEWNRFWGDMASAAVALWPGLFANGQQPHKFSWKYQDGDGVNGNGKSVADKEGFAGHHIVKFRTSFDMACHIEGQFAPHQQLQKPEEVIKRGYWVRLFGKIGSNGATGNKVPGIILYPNILSFVAGSPVDEIRGGPDVAAVAGAHALGYVPEGVARPGSMPQVAGVPGVPQVAVPSVAVPGVPQVTTPSVPQVSVPGVPQVQTPQVPQISVPQTPQVSVPQTPSVPSVPVPQAAPAAPQYASTNPALTVEQFLAAGWTHDAAIAAGHIVRVS